MSDCVKYRKMLIHEGYTVEDLYRGLEGAIRPHNVVNYKGTFSVPRTGINIEYVSDHRLVCLVPIGDE